MKHTALRSILAAFVLVIAAICGGCDRSISESAAASNAAKPDPKASFKRILDDFRRKVEDQPVGFVVNDGGSRSTMVGSNKVTAELVPPVTAADHYKAVITVKSESRYSLRRSKTGSEEKNPDQSSKNQSKNPSAELDDRKPLPVGEPDVASKSGSDSKDSSKSGPAEEIVTRQPYEQVRPYELIYENNRWSLVTELNPKTEKSIQFAFDEALSRQ